MKINLKLDLKSFLPYILKRFSLVLWVFLCLIILAEGFVIKASIDKISKANEQSQFAGSQLVRVNFGFYETIEQRLSKNATFVPQQPNTGDPFGTPTAAN